MNGKSENSAGFSILELLIVVAIILIVSAIAFPKIQGAIESVLRAHSPLPAFAVDRHWNVVLSNAALPQLYEGLCMTETIQPTPNRS